MMGWNPGRGATPPAPLPGVPFLLRFFESLVPAFPEAEPGLPPRGFFAFAWACTQGMRGAILLMTVLTAVIGAFDAVLFAMLGRLVDWLGTVPPAHLWDQHGGLLLLGHRLQGEGAQHACVFIWRIFSHM